jgi:hypothetical protein
LLRTRHEWINSLAAECDALAGMRLDTTIENACLPPEAIALANCNAHCDLIRRSVNKLTNPPQSKGHVRELVADLVQRKTYGAFAELAAYEWLARCNVLIEPQVRMTASDVLAANGSTLDGKITRRDIYFDVKAFGSIGRLANRLRERLQQEITDEDEQVLVDGSWHSSFDLFNELITSAPSIAVELRQKRLVRRDHLHIRLEPKKPVTVSSHDCDAYRLAKENALYPYRDAQQFTRDKPFVLILPVHPWFDAGSLHGVFAGEGEKFTRSLARRAFMQFSNDVTPLRSICPRAVPANTTLADASRLLSGMFFVNVWPLEAMPSWLYSNPRATHPLTDLRLFCSNNPNKTYIDFFADDDY